jgi:hypothetical protein
VKNLLFLASSLLSIGGLLLAFKRRVHGVLLFATLLLSYPLIYYITVPEPRYRHPIEPELLILSVFLLLSLFRLIANRVTSGRDVTAVEKPTLTGRFAHSAAIAFVGFTLALAFT